MKCYGGVLILAVVCFSSFSSAIPKKDADHKDRSVERDLSDQEHYDGEDHNRDYDHEAFLGEESKKFDELTPEESKDRLGKIVDKIDKDKNGQITEEELRDWVKYVANRYISTDTERQWKEHEKLLEDGKLKWESYKERQYDDENDEEDTGVKYTDMIKRDKKRWERADGDKDGFLNQEEYQNFLHPEDVPHMRDIVVEETIDDIDKDGDGFLSLEEYIGDMWPNESGDEEEPDWVKREREQFGVSRDLNKDGKLDQNEVKNWIIPEDYDHTIAEAKHLIRESDENGDGHLSKEEILDKYDVFVGSQATDFGEALTNHDEF